MKKSSITKKRILEKAIEIVADKGYSATSTKEIAREAGVSEATLFKYYGSKDELLKTIVLQTIEDFHDYSLNKALPDTLEKSKNKSISFLMQQLFEERLEFFKQNSQAIQVLFQEMMINEDVKEIFIEKIWNDMVKVANHIFKQGKSNGELKQIDNYFLRTAVFGIFFFTGIMERQLNIIEGNRYTIKEKVENILDLLYNGIGEVNRNE